MARPRKNAGTDRLWERFEQTVQQLLASLDTSAVVQHNQKVPGRLSKAQRQNDVWIRGQVVGLEITVAVECKRHGRVIDVGIVDQFVGKLLDVGADRGIIYSYSGFTDAAVTRAVCASNPFILTVALETPGIVAQASGAPGYPADLLVQEAPPQWVEEMDDVAYMRFLALGEWSKFWS